MQRRDKFDHLVIETTGLADPAPVIQTFFVDEDIQSQLALDAVITVVDAKHIWQHWDSDEAQEQIAFADVILLNKIDLVTEAELEALESRIRDMNAMVKIYRTQNSDLAIETILGVRAFDLDRALEVDPDFLNEDAHEHDDEVYSFAIVEEQPLDSDRLSAWVSDLLQTKGPDIFRTKGILNLAGSDDRYVFQGVHMIFDGRSDRSWKPDETRRSELVFIGRNLDEAEIRKGFRTCLA
jgi:G3E family GTPase